MKKLIRKSIVLALVFTALQGIANVNPKLQNVKGGKTTILTLSGVEEGGMLYIKDSFGHVLYTDSVLASGELVRVFHLNTLKEGSYYFEFNNDQETKRAPFQVSNHKILLDENQKPGIDEKAERSKVRKLLKKNRSGAYTPVEIEKGIQRRTSSFKGQDFMNYYKLN